MTKEQEIRDCFNRQGAQMATRGIFGSKFWDANSQYGYCLKDGFKTKEDAEKFVIAYYSKKMNLIRQ